MNEFKVVLNSDLIRSTIEEQGYESIQDFANVNEINYRTLMSNFHGNYSTRLTFAYLLARALHLKIDDIVTEVK